MNPKLVLPQRYRISDLGNKQRMREQEGCLQTMYYRKGVKGWAARRERAPVLLEDLRLLCGIEVKVPHSLTLDFPFGSKW
jgi:hypothetical protein